MAAEIRAGRLLIVLACLGAALPAMADTRFRVRQMTRNDVPFGEGQCDIRLQIDGEAEVSLRGDTVYIRTITGRDGRDDGSECNQALPGRDVQDFRFEVKESRDEIRLLSEPSRQSGYGAVVRIRDGKGGEGRYHFRIKWTLTGGGGWRGRDEGSMRGRDEGNWRGRDEGNWRGRDEGNWRGRDDGGFGPASPGRDTARWNGTINYTGRGRGQFFRPGEGRRRISGVMVRIERNGRVLAHVNTDRGAVAFGGRVVRVLDDGRITAMMRSEDGRMGGEMLLFVRGDRVREIRMNNGSGRDRVELDWSDN